MCRFWGAAYYNSSVDTDKIKCIKYLDEVIKYSINENDVYFPFAAYHEKGNTLIQLNNIEEAINVYKKGEKIAIERKNDYYHIIRYSIGIAKCEDLGEIDEGLKIFYKCKKAFSVKNSKNQNFPSYYLNSIFSISDVYNSKKQNDSCKKYLEKGIKESKLIGDELQLKRFQLLQSANLIATKNYAQAIKIITSIKPYIYKNWSTTTNPIACDYFLGKAYEGLNNDDNAIKHFKIVDSIYQKTKFITPEFVDSYKSIIDYYKEKKDDKNQIKYLNTFLEIEEKFKKKYRKFYSAIKEQYDVPNLVEEKNTIINKQNYLLILLFVLVIILTILIIINKIRERNRILKFKKVLEDSLRWQKYPLLLENGEIIEQKNEIIDVGRYEVENNNQKPRTKDLSTEVVNDILQKLDIFEKSRGFLNKSLNSSVLAKEFETNPKYLANVINDYKGMKVNDYVSNLRIEYAVLMLQNDKKLRKYNLEALADEFGFNSLVSFNSSFTNKTGIKPAYFIKSLIDNKKNKY